MGLPKQLKKESEQAEIHLIQGEAIGSLATMKIVEERKVDLKNQIICRQCEDPFIEEEIRRISEGRASEFNLWEYNSLWF
jgi:superfamily II helicase